MSRKTNIIARRTGRSIKLLVYKKGSVKKSTQEFIEIDRFPYTDTVIFDGKIITEVKEIKLREMAPVNHSELFSDYIDDDQMIGDFDYHSFFACKCKGSNISVYLCLPPEKHDIIALMVNTDGKDKLVDYLDTAGPEFPSKIDLFIRFKDKLKNSGHWIALLSSEKNEVLESYKPWEDLLFVAE